MRARLPLLLLLAGCGWNHLPDNGQTLLQMPLWDPHAVLPTTDGLYVPLPHSGKLALVRPDGTYAAVETGEGRITRLASSPDGETVVALVERYRCETKNPDLKVRTVEDCPSEDLKSSTEINVLDGTEVEAALKLPGTYNALAFSEDGRFAIAWLDFSDPKLEVSGVVSLTSVMVLDLERELVTPVSVGFAADHALFVHDGGQAVQAVVLSRNSVALLDLTAEVPRRSVTFPLTLDPDSSVVPVGVALTPDGRYAMIPVANRSDLYLLDLEHQSINIVELAGRPADLAVQPQHDRTVLVYGDTPEVEVLDHAFFDLTTLRLDEPMTRVLQGEHFALLYGTSGQHDVYRLDVGTHQLVEYRIENPVASLHLAPTEDFAIALTSPEGWGDGSLYDRSPGMEIIDLNHSDTQPFLLEGQGLGVAWSQSDTRLVALVLQEGVDYLHQLDLYTGRAEQLELAQPPVTIGTMPDGDFYITHENRLGLISFMDPDTNELVEVVGFAAIGIIDPIEVVTTEEQ